MTSPVRTYTPPRGHRVLLENDRVRVMEVRIAPGDKSGMHEHPACVVYALSNSRVRFSFKDGSSRESESKNGDVVFSAGGWHEVENIGATEDAGIIVELKG